jgi:hypothetical protein
MQVVYKQRQEKEREKASLLQNETASIASGKTLGQPEQQKRSTSVFSSIKTGESSCSMSERVGGLNTS